MMIALEPGRGLDAYTHVYGHVRRHVHEHVHRLEMRLGIRCVRLEGSRRGGRFDILVMVI